MRATPTPEQKQGLDTLRHFAPLLRLHGTHVVRWREAVDLDEARRLKMSFEPRRPTAEMKEPFVHALRPFLPTSRQVRWDEAEVTFHVPTGLVEVTAEYTDDSTPGTSYFRIPNWPAANQPVFPTELGPPLQGTLSYGGAGILADWFDDQSSDWDVFTTAIRLGSPFTPERGMYSTNLRWLLLSEHAACWVFQAANDWDAMNRSGGYWAIGFGVFGSDGLVGRWHLRFIPPSGSIFNVQFRSIFPAPPAGSP